MTILNTLKLIEFKPQASAGRIQVRRMKLAEKIDQQIQLVADPNFKPIKLVWTKDERGIEQRREVPKRIKRWWVQNMDGTVQLTIRYGSAAIELAKGKTAIECATAADIAPTLSKIKEAVLSGEIDHLLNKYVGPKRKLG